jgi:hypothetical protein
MKNFTLVSIITFLLIGNGFSQEAQSNRKKFMPSIGLQGGVISCLGDVLADPETTVLTYSKPTYGLYLEKKIGNIFAISSNATLGTLSNSQLDDDVFLNFETSIINFDVNLLLDFDNGKIINKSSLFAPFLSVGVGYLLFDPKGDLSSGGIAYHHWDDGTLRDVSQSIPGSDTSSTIMVRDYDYESTLEDTTNNYARNSITVPVRLGVKFKLSEKLVTRFSAAYILTMTDYIDNVAIGGNDNLFSVSMGLQYNFTSPEQKEDRFKDFDFSDIENEDTDGDGVMDHKDFCQGTPKDVKVDNEGCALDGDEDGVPDYKDKELETVPGSIVTKDGVTLTDEMIANKIMIKDSVQTEYRVFKASDLSKEEQAAIQKQYEDSNNGTSISSVAIPEIFKELDSDKDGFISAKDVIDAIDGFFEGKYDLTAQDLNELIDFFFDQ